MVFEMITNTKKPNLGNKECTHSKEQKVQFSSAVNTGQKEREVHIFLELLNLILVNH